MHLSQVCLDNKSQLYSKYIYSKNKFLCIMSAAEIANRVERKETILLPCSVSTL
jgi:hypothetical protein